MDRGAQVVMKQQRNMINYPEDMRRMIEAVREVVEDF